MAHTGSPSLGLLLTNIGTPAAPTSSALRPYLAEFLGDPRIIELPRWLWLPILHLCILPFRPRRSARLYQNIWTEHGSPLLHITELQAEGIAARLKTALDSDVRVEIGMRYGEPSIADGLQRLRAAGLNRILVFPLFPQYSATTTAATFDAVFDELKKWRWIPELRTLNDYHCHPTYLNAIVNSIHAYWAEHGKPQRLLFSFHGIPKLYIDRGDPYQEQCQQTAALIASQLQLADHEWGISFQSRFGPVDWLQPYTDETLQKWGSEKLTGVHIVCPGFSADCLETLDEVGREGKHIYETAGGSGLAYIPALNASPTHLDALTQIVLNHLQGWIDSQPSSLTIPNKTHSYT